MEIEESLNSKILDELVELSEYLSSAAGAGKQYYEGIPKGLLREAIAAILRLLRALQSYGWKVPKYIEEEYPEYFQYPAKYTAPKKEQLADLPREASEVPADRYLTEQEAKKIAYNRELQKLFSETNKALVESYSASARRDLVADLMILAGRGKATGSVVEGIKTSYELDAESETLEESILRQERELTARIREAEEQRKRKQKAMEEAEIAKTPGVRVKEVLSDRELVQIKNIDRYLHESMKKILSRTIIP